LADATRFLANCLFYHHGLVIVDGNDAALKKCFIPYAEKEFTENLSYKKVSETTEKLTALGFSEQVHPREINLFYLKENLRERIVEQEGRFYVNETDISFSKEEILKELHENPQRFSPNALLRPLYQEEILPNLCYIGGGGELAYWFQLKDYFNKVEVPFPILLLRNSVLLVPKMLSEKLQKLNVSIEDLFLPQHELMTKHTKEISKIDIDFSKQKDFLKQQFKNLYELAKKTDASFLGAVGAQEKKQLNGLGNLEKRLLKAQKRNLSEELERVKNIQTQLFPNQSLQERQLNFSEFYLEYGEGLLDDLKENLEPLDSNFTVLEL
jgi:bacillithiol biosynthesis cysteine-adding enzyme BshC